MSSARPGSLTQLKLFNLRQAHAPPTLAGIFDAIPVLVVVLFAAGMVGIMAYERSRLGNAEKRQR